MLDLHKLADEAVSVTDIVGRVAADFKQVYAIAANADPLHPGTNMNAVDVSDAQAVAYMAKSYTFAGKALFGQRWTDEEYERAWARAQGVA
jgi:hypothetical protein